jgi:hypothetical protein
MRKKRNKQMFKALRLCGYLSTIDKIKYYCSRLTKLRADQLLKPYGLKVKEI